MLKNTLIKTKIALVSFSLAVVALLGNAFLSYNEMKTEESYRKLVQVDDPGTLELTRATDKINALLYATHRMLEQVHTPTVVETRKRFERDIAGMDAVLNEARRKDPQMAQTLAPFNKRWVDLRRLFRQASAATEQGDVEQVLDDLNELDREGVNFALDIGEVANKRIIDVNAKANNIMKSASFSIYACMSIVFLSIIIFSIISYYVSNKGIVSPLLSVRNHMLALARGVLNEEIVHKERGDEVGAMAKALHIMQNALVQARRLEDEQRLLEENAARERELAAERAARDAAFEKQAIDAIRRGLSEAAEGNLTYHVDADFPDRLLIMRDDFNSSFVKLRQTLNAVQSGIVFINSGASEVASASSDISRRIDRQAQSIEQSSVALGRVSGMLRDSAESAQKVAEVTDKARETVEHSAQKMQGAVDAMGRIEGGFKEISQVIGLIDDIAFQTNLLALNAGIEAARAGDAGSGFAVVAREVRTLALRSAESARQVKELVSNSGRFVQDGVVQVNDAGVALANILRQVGEINQHVAEIAHASSGQSAAVEEINVAVGEMTQTVQQNAAMLEETTTSIASLDQEAMRLKKRISHFKLESEGYASDGAEAYLTKDKELCLS
ncbi:methyl-accepting chemotaxis protein [Neokomagataea thailandica]|nr:HAMP domain-containing methyl-accepting chemotaxis protein [Neokomagataea thailandica]